MLTTKAPPKVDLKPISTVHHGSSPIGALDNSVSPIMQSILDERRDELAKRPIKQQARLLLSDRLAPSRTKVSLRDLDDAADDTLAQVKTYCEEVVQSLVQRGHAGRGRLIGDEEAAYLVKYLMATQFGAGEFEPLFHEGDVEDIVISTVPTGRRSTKVVVTTYRQSGRRDEKLDVEPADVIEMVNRFARRQGRQLSPVTPILNAQMPNGARINAVLNPVCDPYLRVTIRVHRLIARTFEDLVRLGTLSVSAAAWLYLCIRAKLSLCVAGGTSSGKTNLLNALSTVIDPGENLICIEDTRELKLSTAYPAYLVTVTSQDGSRTVTQRQLVANALRMRPDRLILGEVRDEAAFDALKACNTGHDGTLLTVHADDADAAPARLIELAYEAPEASTLPERTLKSMVARAFHLVVFIERRTQVDGSSRRMITQINELSGHVQNDVISQQRLFEYTPAQGLVWTKAMPQERTKRRLVDAGITEKLMLDALNGRIQPWLNGTTSRA
ncbi:MAG: CpaF family protein [Anaerolineae bacterium]|nr:CpaF family protein [Anaerolineae bacterium]